MTTRREYHVISADSHTVEPPDLWEKWLERKYQDTVPKLVEDRDGGHAWLYMGATTPEPLGLVTCVGTHPEELKWTGKRYGVDIHPSCHDGAERLKVLDADGVDAEMLYPPQRAVLTFMKGKDRDAHLAGMKVPSEYFRDHMLATFIVDHSGITVRHLVGVANMAWSTDFPHHGNDWPYSRRTIDSLFTDVPAEERRKIVCTNAARFWGLIA